MLKPYDVFNGTIITLNASFVLYDSAVINPTGDPALKVFIDQQYAGLMSPGESFEIPYNIRELRFEAIDPDLRALVRAGIVKVLSKETTITGAVAISNSLTVLPGQYCKTKAVFEGRSFSDPRSLTLVTSATYTNYFYFLPVGSTKKVLLSSAQIIGEASGFEVYIEKFSFTTDPGSSTLATSGFPAGNTDVKKWSAFGTVGTAIAGPFPTAVSLGDVKVHSGSSGMDLISKDDSPIGFTGGMGVRFMCNSASFVGQLNIAGFQFD